MGKRSQQLRCTVCDETWWVWFDTETRQELAEMAATATGEHCPNCWSQDWRLTDATRFAGGPIHTTAETCPQCGYGGRVRMRCPNGHDWIPHAGADGAREVDHSRHGREATTPLTVRVPDSLFARIEALADSEMFYNQSVVAREALRAFVTRHHTPDWEAETVERGGD